MDRKEAVEWIEKAMEYMGLLPCEFWIDGKIGEAVDLAIEALQEPQITPCKECIWAGRCTKSVSHWDEDGEIIGAGVLTACSWGERRDP